ncbi:hypothetical protein GCM10029964_081790 [Kibdelosporangium lantanae]
MCHPGAVGAAAGEHDRQRRRDRLQPGPVPVQGADQREGRHRGHPDSAQKDEGDATAEVGTGTDAAILATTRSAGYYKSYYEDPVQLDVNSVTNSTTWSWNGSSVLSSPGPVGGYHYGWFKGSGWSLKENNWQNTYTSYQTTSSSYVHYRNGTFCATIDTHTYYDRNNVHGRKDGWLLGNVNARKKGGCTSLLSFHTKLKRTKN